MLLEISSNRLRDSYLTSVFWEAKQLKSSLANTLRLADSKRGIMGTISAKVMRAGEATFELGSLAILANSSTTLVLYLCWVTSSGYFLMRVAILLMVACLIFHYED
jgi:hypothetical protein